METAREHTNDQHGEPRPEITIANQTHPSSDPAPGPDSMDISPRKNPLKRTHDSANGDNQGDDAEPSTKRARQDSTNPETTLAKPSLVRANSTGNPDRSKSIQLREWKSEDGHIIQVRIGDITLEDTGSSPLTLVQKASLLSLVLQIRS